MRFLAPPSGWSKAHLLPERGMKVLDARKAAFAGDFGNAFFGCRKQFAGHAYAVAREIVRRRESCVFAEEFEEPGARISHEVHKPHYGDVFVNAGRNADGDRTR